jgi:hypothetical protein
MYRPTPKMTRGGAESGWPDMCRGLAHACLFAWHQQKALPSRIELWESYILPEMHAFRGTETASPAVLVADWPTSQDYAPKGAHVLALLANKF